MSEDVLDKTKKGIVCRFRDTPGILSIRGRNKDRVFDVAADFLYDRTMMCL